MTGGTTLENKLNIVLVLAHFFGAVVVWCPTLPRKDLLLIEGSWAALTSLSEFHNKLCSQKSGMVGEGEESLRIPKQRE